MALNPEFWGKILVSLPFYTLTLGGQNPPKYLRPMIPDPGKGNITMGQRIVSKKVFHDSTGAVQWFQQPYEGYLHTFEWLYDLRETGTNSGRRKAREMMSQWISENSNYHPVSWRVDIMGKRLSAWTGLFDFFCASAEDGFKNAFFKSLFQQICHLNRAIRWEEDKVKVMMAMKGLIQAQIAVPAFTQEVAGSLSFLDRLLKNEFLEDGGHPSGDPELHLYLLKDLLDLRGTIRQARLPLPDQIGVNIDRLAPVVQFFKMGDGNLAAFGEGEGVEGAMLAAVLNPELFPESKIESLPFTGFDRVVSQELIAVIKSKGTASNDLFSVDITHGADRILKGGGAMKKTTSILKGHSEEDWGAMGQSISRDRQVMEGTGTLLTLKAQDMEDLYTRNLYFSESGLEVKGEEWFQTPYPRRTERLLFYFDLGPFVTAKLHEDGMELGLPRGASWMFRWGGNGTARLISPSRIGVTAVLKGNSSLRVKWSLKKVKED